MVFSNRYIKSKELKDYGIKCGKNCLVHESVLILNNKNLILGNNVRIDARCNIINSGKMFIGNYVSIAPNCIFWTSNKYINIGDYAHLSDNVRIYCTNEIQNKSLIVGPFSKMTKKVKRRLSNIIISPYSIIGSASLIIPFAKFNRGSCVGANSMVNKELKAWTTHFGVPLREISKRRFRK